MGLIVGPTPWWQSELVAELPEGSALPDGSRIICKAGGVAWIIAPSCTQVCSTWNGTTTTQVGNQPNVSSWSSLCSIMISCGFNPSDWFVPSISQLQNPGYVCRSRWDSYINTPGFQYWSSTEVSSTNAYTMDSTSGTCTGGSTGQIKSVNATIRAFRCVTY